jgi:predicted nucleic acid-binding Zn ribbon protein
MEVTEPAQRCPACRARIGVAEVCSRCGTDFSIVRRAERQAQVLAGLAVQQLVLGQTEQAAASAKAASALADAPLARAVSRLLSQFPHQ